ncbi:MAG: Hcp family type VI secretion system effector, partial [Terracidiphilus sp.]
VRAAYDAYLKIEGLDGGSKDPAHMGWIAISRVTSGDLGGAVAADRESSSPSVSELTVRKAGGSPGNATKSGNSPQKAAQAPRDIASGQASGKRMHKPFVITKEIDKSSPMLAAACASGKHFPSAMVDIGAKQYKLFDVMIASVQRSSGGDRPMETITLHYEKIEIGQ